MTKVFVSNIGTTNEKERKDYATAAGACQRAQARLKDFRKYAAKYNPALAVEITEAHKEVGKMSMYGMPPGRDNAVFWRLVDETTGMDLVIQLWVEEQ